MDQSLEKYDRMVTAIAECHRIDEVKDIRDKALALAAYARQAKNYEAEAQAAEVRVRAERRCGELLIEMGEKGERHKGHGDQKSESRNKTPIPTLSDLGLTKQQSSEWQQLAEIPEDIFGVLAKSQRSSARIIDAYERSQAAPDEGDSWQEHWIGMPAFHQEDRRPLRTLHVHFKTEQDIADFAQLVGQKIGLKTRFIWYPESATERVSHLRWVTIEAATSECPERAATSCGEAGPSAPKGRPH